MLDSSLTCQLCNYRGGGASALFRDSVIVLQSDVRDYLNSYGRHGEHITYNIRTAGEGLHTNMQL